MIEYRPLFQCPLKVAILRILCDDIDHTVGELVTATDSTHSRVGLVLTELARRGYVESNRVAYDRARRWRITIEGKVALLVAGIPQLA